MVIDVRIAKWLLADQLHIRSVKDSPVKPYQLEGHISYFIDRDPKHFPLILNYLRNGGRLNSDMTPRDVRQLRELQVEANFYELRHLERVVLKRIQDLQYGIC